MVWSNGVTWSDSCFNRIHWAAVWGPGWGQWDYCLAHLDHKGTNLTGPCTSLGPTSHQAPQACAHGRTPPANPPCHEQKATADNCQVSKIRHEPKLQICVWYKWRRNTVNHPCRWSSSGLHALDIEISLASLHQICQHPGTCAKPSRKHYAWIFPFSKKEKHDLSSSLLHSDRSSSKPCMARWRHQKHS